MAQRYWLALLLLGILFIVVSPTLSHAVLPAPVPCKTSADCQSMCSQRFVSLGPYCTCVSDCKDYGRGLECEGNVRVATNLSNSYFESKAEQYAITVVGEKFFKNHYNLSGISISSINRNSVFVDFNYTADFGEVFDAQGIVFDGCTGQITRISMWLNQTPIVINRSEAMSIAESQGLQKYTFRNGTKDWISVSLNFGGYGNSPGKAVWVVSSYYCFVDIDATNGNVLSYTPCSEPPGSPQPPGLAIFFIPFIIMVLIILAISRFKKLRLTDTAAILLFMSAFFLYFTFEAWGWDIIFAHVYNSPGTIGMVPEPFWISFFNVYLPTILLFSGIILLIKAHSDELKDKTKNISKMWYLIPLLVLVTTLSFEMFPGVALPSIFPGQLGAINSLENMLLSTSPILFLPLLSAFLLGIAFNRDSKFCRNIILLGLIAPIIILFPDFGMGFWFLVTIIPFLIFTFLFALYNSWFLSQYNRRKSLVIIASVLVLTAILIWLLRPIPIQ